jgi:hypothetical protein
MVKLFSDEEMDEMCKDYRSIPLELRSQVFSIDNENSKLPIGYVAPVNINQYSLSLHKYYGLDSMKYIEEYNKLYDKNIPTVDEPPVDSDEGAFNEILGEIARDVAEKQFTETGNRIRGQQFRRQREQREKKEDSSKEEDK